MYARGKGAVLKKPKNTKGTLIRLLKYIGDFKWILLIVVLLSLTSNMLALLGPSLAGKAIKEASAGIGNVDFEKVYYHAIRMLCYYVISSLLSICISVIMMHVSRRIGEKMRKDIFAKLMKLPIRFFDNNQAGDIISRVSYDVDVVSTSIGTDIVAILTSGVTIVGSFIMMSYISPLLSLVSVVTILIAVVYTVKIRKVTQPRFAKRSKQYGMMNGFVEEMFSGQKSIVAYAYEDEVCNKFDKINHETADAYYDAAHYAMMMGPTVMFINNVGLSLTALFGSLLYMRGLIDLGGISSFVLYSRKFSGPINEIAGITTEIYSALSAAERIFSLYDEVEELADQLEAVELTDAKGLVQFKQVSFGYDRNKTIIHNLNLDVEAGKVIAIVGPTGAGKTTIINLLMRFYDVNEGSVSVDGRKIQDYTRESLRKNYAMVLQDTWVFQGTIFDNIAYGKENATMEEVVAAAKAAHIHPFIMRLPKGYDTVISEDGGNISKGQKQLLTIARAMLYNSNMLILDEATSNVDTSTEHQIQNAMKELMKGRTCFVIAHRLSTVQNADMILVVDHGDIVEQGNHEQLMKTKGVYYNLYSAQFE